MSTATPTPTPLSPADRAAHEAASYVRRSAPPVDALSAALSRDNRREDAGMPADDRSTCWTHQSWAEDCADHPMHTDPHGYVLRQLNTREVVS